MLFRSPHPPPPHPAPLFPFFFFFFQTSSCLFLCLPGRCSDARVQLASHTHTHTHTRLPFSGHSRTLKATFPAVFFFLFFSFPPFVPPKRTHSFCLFVCLFAVLLFPPPFRFVFVCFFFFSSLRARSAEFKRLKTTSKR